MITASGKEIQEPFRLLKCTDARIYPNSPLIWQDRSDCKRQRGITYLYLFHSWDIICRPGIVSGESMTIPRPPRLICTAQIHRENYVTFKRYINETITIRRRPSEKQITSQSMDQHNCEINDFHFTLPIPWVYSQVSPSLAKFSPPH